MAKRDIGSEVLKKYLYLPGGVRKYTDKVVKGGAAVARKLHGDGAKRKGSAWANNQKNKVKKQLSKYRI
jgi:hypothetical protein